MPIEQQRKMKEIVDICMIFYTILQWEKQILQKLGERS